MSFVLNRITKEYLANVDSATYDTADWIINPEVTDLVRRKVPAKYWRITGDVVSEEPQTSKDAIDTAEQVVQDNFEIDQERSFFDKPHLKAFAEILLDEINILRAELGLAPRTFKQLRTAIRNRVGV